MKYLLDSNTIIALVMNNDAGVVARAGECEEGDLVTSAVAYAEVMFGSLRQRPPAFTLLHAFVEEVPVLHFGIEAATAYASLPFKRASFDRLIAAHALSLDVAVVTRNLRDYDDIPGLRVEDWSE